MPENGNDCECNNFGNFGVIWPENPKKTKGIVRTTGCLSEITKNGVRALTVFVQTNNFAILKEKVAKKC